MSFDPRTLGTPVYEALDDIFQEYKTDETRIREQRSQAVEIYTYLATWGMMRLKAEDIALSQDGKRDVVRAYFTCLQRVTDLERDDLSSSNGLRFLKDMDGDEYLGLSGVGLAIAQEFSFWATAVYKGYEGDK